MTTPAGRGPLEPLAAAVVGSPAPAAQTGGSGEPRSHEWSQFLLGRHAIGARPPAGAAPRFSGGSRSGGRCTCGWCCPRAPSSRSRRRSEEHTSELQSRLHLVCRLLLEKKKNT